MAHTEDTMTIRDQLVQIVLKWENMFGFFPGQAGITAAVSEYDAAMMLGLNEAEYITSITGRGPVGRGHDFVFENKRIQVKANRPSGRPGDAVWNAGPKVKTDGWDILIYILYDKDYVRQEAYGFDCDTYERLFSDKKLLRLDDMRKGKNLLNISLNREGDEMDDSTQAIIRRADSPSSVQVTGLLTDPPSYGVYMLPANCGTTRRYRFGNHPVRMQELKREFAHCTLKHLFLSRADAMALTSILNTPDPRIEELLVALKADGKSSPKDWHQFYLFLEAKKQAGQKDPPVPLILAASMESDDTKHRRLSDQLHWAHENGCLDDVLRYLRDIPGEDWNLSSLGQWNQDSYPNYSWGWTSDPKPKMSVETATKLIEHLRANWDEIAGPELRAVTLPRRFAGAKGRRLLVFARKDSPPPWGTWTTLDRGKNKRFFTRLRAAVNAAIKPLEVDHIDFVEVDHIDFVHVPTEGTP